MLLVSDFLVIIANKSVELTLDTCIERTRDQLRHQILLYHCIFRLDTSLSPGLDVLSVGDKILEVNGMPVKESSPEEV